jgi:transcriptional regulator with XRE-family HTH domain
MDSKTLKEKRQAQGLSQDKLSVLSGISQFAISQIETGKAVPNRNTRAQLESVLGVINWLDCKGLRTLKARTSQDLETALLKTLYDVHSLPTQDRGPFLDRAGSYIQELRNKI